MNAFFLRRWFALVLVFSVAHGLAAPAEREALPASEIAPRGKLVVSEDLASAPAEVVTSGGLGTLRSGWRFVSGKWEFVDGALRGGEEATLRRSAQAVRVHPFSDAVMQFEVRLEGCRMVQFRVQDSTPEHICRMFITHEGFSAQKDDHDHAGPDVAVPFGKAAYPIKDGEWKTVRMEIRGDRLTATIDGQSISGQHPLLAAPKHFFEFIVTGASASFRNLRVWETK